MSLADAVLVTKIIDTFFFFFGLFFLWLCLHAVPQRLQTFELDHLKLVVSAACPIVAVFIMLSPYNIFDELTAEHWYTLFYALNLVGVMFSLVLLWEQGVSITRGLMMSEVLHKVYDHDSGSVKQNLLTVKCLDVGGI